jgi:lysophospholipase L1-like esterase
MIAQKNTRGKVSCIALAMMLLFFQACSKDKETSTGSPVVPVDTTTPVNNVVKSYLALGDSYTIGSSVTMDERFPKQTVNNLLAAGVQVNLPEYNASGGWTTADLLNSLNNSPPSKSRYDLVSLLIGVNNQYQRGSQETYRVQFTELLNRAIAYAGGRKSRVFVLSIPDYSVTPFAQYSDTARISDEIDQFNNINRQISQEMGVQYLNITPISREGRADPTMQAADGLHPSGKQYQRWASLLSPAMKAAL